MGLVSRSNAPGDLVVTGIAVNGRRPYNRGMASVTLEEAKTNFGGLMEYVTRGEEVVISDNGIPIARVTPQVRPKRRFGIFPGPAVPDDRLFAPLSEEELAAWE